MSRVDQAMQLAIQNHQAGRLAQAEAIYRQVLIQEPNHANALHLLGVIASQIGRLDEAVDLIQRAIAINPAIAGFHNNLGNALRGKGLYEDAAVAYRNAIRLKPDFAEAYNNLGNALSDQGRYDEAIAACRDALRLNPGYAEAYNNLGCAFLDQGKWREALKAFRKAIEIKPAYASAHWNHSRVLLTLGEWKEGWAEFDSRLRLPHLGLNRGFPQPQWDGADPSGKTILLHAEGGHGDALNFIRFVPQVAQLGAKLILECQAALAPLFEGLAGLDRVIARGQPLPPFDWQIPLQSLPHVLGLTAENVPNKVPYLSAPADSVRRWADRLAGETKRRVGLAWAGTKHAGQDARTRTIDVFAPLAEVPGVRFFSLQVGEASRQSPPKGIDWADFSAELTDFAETAALVQNLDLIVSVDTSVAHLAGALAKPTWVLIPFQSDFRWLLERTDTPWYPTMRLFRQKRIGDWTEVIQRVVRALVELGVERSEPLEKRKING